MNGVYDGKKNTHNNKLNKRCNAHLHKLLFGFDVDNKKEQEKSREKER